MRKIYILLIILSFFLCSCSRQDTQNASEKNGIIRILSSMPDKIISFEFNKDNQGWELISPLEQSNLEGVFKFDYAPNKTILKNFLQNLYPLNSLKFKLW